MWGGECCTSNDGHPGTTSPNSFSNNDREPVVESLIQSAIHVVIGITQTCDDIVQRDEFGINTLTSDVLRRTQTTWGYGEHLIS